MSAWPAWMTGRIGLDPPQGWRDVAGLRAISAPNKFRNAWRTDDVGQADIIAMQRVEYPDMPDPMGLDIDPTTWDQILIWRRERANA